MKLLDWLFGNGAMALENLSVWRTLLVLAIVVIAIVLLRWLFRRVAAVFRRWDDALKKRRIDRLTARATDIQEDEHYDLMFLHAQGFVRVCGTGRSITEVYVEVENLIRKRIHVMIMPGTYFMASGVHQNMVTRTEYILTVYPCGTERVAIKAACINAGRPIPGTQDRFYGVARVSDKISRFLEATKEADPMVAQAGVWALTDGYSAHDVRSRLIARDQYGTTRQAISDSHIAEARRILNSLGIRNNL